MAAASSSANVRKRQYQPFITSYFNGGPSRSQTSRSPLSPPLDAETQASLLNVGMRVRKSVPDGYKTHKTLSMDGFPFPSTAPATSTTSVRPNYSHVLSRELMPFCGLHKIGGLASQPQSYVPSSSAPAAVSREVEDEEDDTPGLTASQQTMPSTQGSLSSAAWSQAAAPNKKRTFEEEIEDDMDAFFDGVGTVDSAATGRPIAKPKASLRRAPTDETMAAVDGEDFEDAAFLAPMDVAED